MKVAKIKQNILKQAFNPLHLFNEARLNFTSDCVNIKAMDKSYLIEIHISIPKHIFKQFEKNDTKMGITVENINVIDHLFTDDSVINIEIDETKRKLEFSNDSSRYVQRGPDIKYMRIRGDNEINPLQCEFTVDDSVDELLNGIQLANNIATHCVVQFRIKHPAIIMCANGDTDTIENMVYADNIQISDELYEQDKSDLELKLPLDKFIDITKILPRNKAIKIGMTNQDELVISYPVVDNIGKVNIKLAGRL